MILHIVVNTINTENRPTPSTQTKHAVTVYKYMQKIQDVLTNNQTWALESWIYLLITKEYK